MPNTVTHPLITLARAVAITAHAGQVDKANEPYFRHPERVAASFGTTYALDQLCTVIAYLHDTLEDTPLTPADLRDIGFPARAIAAVETLTRRPNETYAQFIERVATDSIAVRVKLADLADNLDPARRWQPGTSHRARYLRAQERLGQAISEGMLR